MKHVFISQHKLQVFYHRQSDRNTFNHPPFVL